MSEDTICKTHPDAPHGFCRDASHMEDRYVCECEFWTPPIDEIESLRKQVAELEKDLEIERRLSFRTQVGILEESIETCKVTEQMYRTSKEYAFEDLRKAQARIAELREALSIAMANGDYLKSEKEQLLKVLNRTDDTSALSEYRNSVIDECASELDDYDLMQKLYRMKR